MSRHTLALQTSFRDTPTTPSFRDAVINKLWGTNPAHPMYSPTSDSPYFHHIYEELSANARREAQDVQLAAQVSHGYVLDIVVRLMDPAMQPSSVFEILGGRTPRAERCLRLAAGLLLPLNFEGIGGR